MSLLSTRTHPDTWTEQELLQTLHGDIADALVVTSNVRAARAWRQRYNQWQHAAGNRGWRTPQILAWEPWLETLWNSATIGGIETRLLLTDAQELEIWRTILAQDEAARRTLSVASLAELAQSAWKEMQRHGVPLRALRGDGSVDTQAFYRWAAEFERHCQKSSFLSGSQLEAAIGQWLPSNQIALPKEIFLIGFDRVTAAQAALIRALDASGCAVHAVKLRLAGAGVSTPAIVYAPTREEEIAAAAHWIRHALISDPTQRIGVVVPALAEARDAIDATFRRILAPSSMDVRNTQTTLPYEFSLGTPMQRMPDIRTALTLLQWMHEALPAEEISWLLVHGGFSDATAMQDRARLDRRFRDRDCQLGGPVPFAAFRQWLAQLGNRQESAPLRRTVERLFAERLFVTVEGQGLERSRSFAEWREVIEEILATADWHLLKAVESRDYQLLARWNALLDDLSSLNTVTGLLKFSAVLEKLRHLAAHMLFTLETRNAPVQILGISESAGLVFDTVWWLHAQASVWPLRGNAQPFLPWNVRREAHMPYADPAEDYVFAGRVTERVLNSGTSVVVSFGLEESDPTNASSHRADREVLVSPLIREVLPSIPMVSVEEFVPGYSSVQWNGDADELETIGEEAAVPFQSSQVRGGVRFLELQAACPFRAFAELRLGTRPLAEFGGGLSRNDQGTVMHRALHRFWREMQSQEKLLARSGEELRQSLREHIHAALADFFRHANEPWQTALLEIESDRMEARLLEWLEQEKKRSPFKVLETEHTFADSRLGGIALECRIDRIDAVEPGIVLLDYKTGEVDRNACEGDRPDQPQLPAYAVLRNQAADEPLAGVAFAGLHPQKVGFIVVGSLPSIFEARRESAEASSSESRPGAEPRVKPKWNPAALSPEEMRVQQETWSATLTRLAEDFRSGAAVVDPKKAGETCRFCAQGLLCRIRETTATVTQSLDEDEHESFSDSRTFKESSSS